MNQIRIYITIALLLFGVQGFSQHTEAWASPDTNAITIGDQIGLNIGVKLDKDDQVIWPQIGDTITGNIEVVKRETIDTTFDADQMIIKQRIVITSFDSGYFEVPPFKFLYSKKGDTVPNLATTGSFYLQVYTPQVDTAQPFKTIKGPIEEPYTLGEILPWVLTGLAALAVIVLLILYFVKRKKNQPLFRAKAKPLPPPHVEAIDKLEKLRLARVWQSGKIKQYYSALTDIMRNYLKRRFDFDATEMTTDEILAELQNHVSNKEATEKLKGMMQLADLVKFAKAKPTPLENDLSLNHCIDFVQETKAVVTEPNEEDKTKLLDKKKDSNV